MKFSLNIFALFLITALIACAPTAPETAPPTSIPVQTEPSSTPLPQPTNTPVPPTETLEPTQTPDPVIFLDNFDSSLSEGWNWTKENKNTWSLTKNPGWLEIMVSRGGIGNGNLDNVLLRPVPDGNFEIETSVNFQPTGDFQFAGIVVYESAANFIQFGRAFCDYPNVCANDGFYVDNTSGGTYEQGNFATSAKNNEISYLRFRREGNKYTAYASQDNVEWQLIGEKTNDMNPKFIGLLAGQAMSAPKPAQFDYFKVIQVQ
jgi:beta-xylosidase